MLALLSKQDDFSSNKTTGNHCSTARLAQKKKKRFLCLQRRALATKREGRGKRVTILRTKKPYWDLYMAAFLFRRTPFMPFPLKQREASFNSLSPIMVLTLERNRGSLRNKSFGCFTGSDSVQMMRQSRTKEKGKPVRYERRAFRAIT